MKHVLVAITLALGSGAALAAGTDYGTGSAPPSGSSAPPSGSSSMPSSGDTSAASFAALDVDADGKLSKAEATVDPVLKKNFKSLDADKDGNLSAQEFASASQAGGNKRNPG
jgi:hypothetical protein